MNYTRQSKPADAGQKTEFRYSAALPAITKYKVWYDRIVDRARFRAIPKCYTEVHHILPRALGGGDEPANLVRLTYREHFLVHWLLTKFCIGKERRAMHHALNAMTMPISGQRIVAGWQFEATKRALRDLQDDPEVHEAFMARYRAAQEASKVAEAERIQALKDERHRKREALEADILQITDMSRDQAKQLAGRILRHRSKKLKVKIARLHHDQPPRKRSSRKSSKVRRKEALEHLKKLGLRLNG